MSRYSFVGVLVFRDERAAKKGEYEAVQEDKQRAGCKIRHEDESWVVDGEWEGEKESPGHHKDSRSISLSREATNHESPSRTKCHRFEVQVLLRGAHPWNGGQRQ